MLHIFRKLTLSLILFFGVTFSALAAETYTFDSNHSYLLWQVSHFGFSKITGRWPITGTVVLDELNPKNSKVNVTIHMADLLTGVPKLDEHLRGKDFFDVEKFPTATYVSNKVDVIGKNSAKVYGTLTVHGVSKPVMLHVKLNKNDVNPITSRKTMGFSANTEIKRSDFEVRTFVPAVSDEVKISIEAEVYAGKPYTE